MMIRRNVIGLVIVCLGGVLAGLSLTAQPDAESIEAIRARVEVAVSGHEAEEILEALEVLGEKPDILRGSPLVGKLARLYDRVDQLNFSEENKEAIKKKIIDRLSTAGDHRGVSFLKDITDKEQDIVIRRYAMESLQNYFGLSVAERMDVSMFIEVDGEVLTYETAYKVLVERLNSPDIDVKQRAVNDLIRFGNSLKGDEVIAQAISQYTKIPSPPASAKPVDPHRPRKPMASNRVDSIGLTDAQWKQAALKGSLLRLVVVSGDPRRRWLLSLAETDDSPIIKAFAADLREWIRAEGELQPGATQLSTKATRGAKAPERYYIDGNWRTREEFLADASRILAADDRLKIQKLLNGALNSKPYVIRGTAVFEELSRLFHRAVLWCSDDPKNADLEEEVRHIRTLVLYSVAYSNDTRAKRLLEAAKKDRDREIAKSAEDLLLEIS